MPGQIRVSKTTTVTFYGPTTVADLRRFVHELGDTDGAARVSFEHYKGDQRDSPSFTITVHGVGA